MKIKILILAVITSICFSACEDDVPAVADFSATSIAPYIELTTKTALTVKQGATASLAFRTRENFQQPVTVTYTVTGAFTATGTATMARNTLAGTISIAVPANVVPVGSTSINAVVTLKSAVMGTQNLTIGYLNSAGEVRTLKITP